MRTYINTCVFKCENMLTHHTCSYEHNHVPILTHRYTYVHMPIHQSLGADAFTRGFANMSTDRMGHSHRHSCISIRIHMQLQSAHRLHMFMPTCAHKPSLCKICEQVFSLRAWVKAEGVTAAGRRGRAQRPRPSYSSGLIVWFGTVRGMLPHKLNNSCPPFNLFDLDDNNLLYAMEFCLLFSPNS